MNEIEKPVKPALQLFNIENHEQVHVKPLNSLNLEHFQPLTVEKKPFNKVGWAFRVLMNNLIFAGVLMGGSMAFNMGYAHKAIYTTQSSSPGNPYSTIDITKTSQHIVLKSIMANDFASFKKYASPSKYFNNHNDLHISPFQLAVIYNNTDMVQYMIKNLKSIPNMNLSIMPEYNNKADNYSLLLLPQIMQTQTPGNNNFGFASKKLLIEAGADVSLDNYKIVSSTLSNPEWRSFWKQYFEKQNKTAILKSLMKDSIKDKEDLIRDIHNIEALTKSL